MYFSSVHSERCTEVERINTPHLHMNPESSYLDSAAFGTLVTSEYGFHQQ